MRGSKILDVMRDMIEKRMPKIFEFATVTSDFPAIAIEVDGSNFTIKKEFLVVPERLAPKKKHDRYVVTMRGSSMWEWWFNGDDWDTVMSSIEGVDHDGFLYQMYGQILVHGVPDGEGHGGNILPLEGEELKKGDRVIVQLLSDQQRYLIVDRIAED